VKDWIVGRALLRVLAHALRHTCCGVAPRGIIRQAG